MGLFNRDLSDNELELLHMIRNIGLTVTDWHRENFKNADAIQAKFLKQGYIRSANMEELIFACYKVIELKKIASKNNLKTTGMRKEDLVQTLISQLPKTGNSRTFKRMPKI